MAQRPPSPPAPAPAPRPPARRTAARQPAASPAGPLTLAQARALVAAQASRPASSASVGPAPGTRSSPRSATGLSALAPETTAADLGAERRRRAQTHRRAVQQRSRDYAATMALLKRHGVKGLPTEAPAPAPTGAAKRRGSRATPRDALAGATGPLQILAEGDSWFDYPVPLFGGGLIPRLEKRLGLPILNLAKAGDETRYMLGVEQRIQLTERLRSGSPAGGAWDVLLFSGGGNDIVDNPLALWLKPFDPALSPAEQLNAPRFAAALALVRAAYEDLIALRDAHSPGTHLVFHCYDFALPDGRGICNLGPWLKPAFDLRGFPDQASAWAVVKDMLGQFAAMLVKLGRQPGVTVVNAQGTLAPVKAAWHNELHPAKDGFNQMADIFANTLRTLFPARVPA